ncbi:MAG: CehA/McbA family metallohydrolase [Bryobacteraceae bacterium]|nr:CehA/McbA family metallohydrolase [Bryobacteraceae bacterium]MDW8378242.1 CehA/McbA family metallohydrolase [Bryobacterales bacterium]
MSREALRRALLGSASVLLLVLAWWSTPPAGAGQSAVAHSLPGQEPLTFWVHRNGLIELDAEGEIGFGDVARILMRRRANATRLRALRDRFVFRRPEVQTLAGLAGLLSEGAHYVIAQNRVFNLPEIRGSTAYLHRIVEPAPGVSSRRIHGVAVQFDVRPLHRLKVRLLDYDGRPTTARVYLTGADGLAYAPKGSISRFAAEPAEAYFHAASAFEVDLPAGKTLVEATRGPEYLLVAREIDLQQPTEITLQLERWTHMAQRGWYSSDSHIHANYTASHHQDITPDDVRTYMLGEDLHIPNLLVANSVGAFIHDRKFFEGKLSSFSQPPYLLYWNEEMRNAGLYGHMCFYGLKTLVEPMYTGFRDTPYPYDYPANYHQALRAQQQGGAVTYAHPGYAATLDGASMREAPVDVALGVVDAIDVLSNNPEEVALELWYKLLNCGFRVGISAGTDSFTNVADHYVPGGGRVYAKPEGRYSYASWLAAYKKGRTFATNGPMLALRVNGREPGEEIVVAPGAQLEVEVQVHSAVPVDPVELVINGQPQPYRPRVTLDTSAWIAARVQGPWSRLILNDARAFAHTSPVYVLVDGKPLRSRQDAEFWLDWIDQLIARTRQRGQFESESQRKEVLALFQKARAIYELRR